MEGSDEGNRDLNVPNDPFSDLIREGYIMSSSSGIVEAYWEYQLKPWDTCAGVIILTEAGGKVTTMDGKPYRCGGPTSKAVNDPIVPSNSYSCPPTANHIAPSCILSDHIPAQPLPPLSDGHQRPPSRPTAGCDAGTLGGSREGAWNGLLTLVHPQGVRVRLAALTMRMGIASHMRTMENRPELYIIMNTQHNV